MHGQDARLFNAYTAESTVNFLTQNWIWTRLENVDRDRTLVIGENPAVLPVYGNRPVGISVFLHLRPKGNIGTSMQIMHQH
jgi:hypothetical protein